MDTRVIVTCYQPDRNLKGTLLDTYTDRWTGEKLCSVAMDNPPKGFNRIWNVAPKYVIVDLPKES